MATGEEAWRCCRGERPDLVLLDALLPDVEGIVEDDAVRKLRPASRRLAPGGWNP